MKPFDSVGGKVLISLNEWDRIRRQSSVFVQMAIRAPNGDTCRIFGDDSKAGPQYMLERRQLAVRVFMEQHTVGANVPG